MTSWQEGTGNENYIPGLPPSGLSDVPRLGRTNDAGTLTTDVKVLNLSATWNAAGVTFTGLQFNVTNTASATGSLLLDFQVGGVSKFYCRKDGYAEFAGGSKVGGIGLGAYEEGSVDLFSNSGKFSLGIAFDVVLRRDAANALAQRNGASAQTLRLYNTYTDASNYQRLEMGWNTSTALVMNTGAGTGTDGSVAFNDAALATTATKGFVMIPSCAGAPTGVPADIPTGQMPMVFDSTNNKIYVYDGAWLATVALL